MGQQGVTWSEEAPFCWDYISPLLTLACGQPPESHTVWVAWPPLLCRSGLQQRVGCAPQPGSLPGPMAGLGFLAPGSEVGPHD